MTLTEQKTALKPAKLILEHDSDVENPCGKQDGWGWVVHSFNRRHSNCTDPSDFLNRDGSGVNIGIQRRLDCGTAFLLSCYEHSGCAWSLQGEGTQCQWDTTRTAGIMIWQGKAKDAGKNLKEREERARSSISVYSDWANGTCYYFRLEDEDGEEIAGSGGYIGDKDLESAVLEAVKEHGVEITEVDGDAEWLWKYIRPNDIKPAEPKTQVTA
jgi:hypothetical protein